MLREETRSVQYPCISLVLHFLHRILDFAAVGSWTRLCSKMTNRERDAKLKSKQRKKRPKKLKLGHVPGVEHFKVAAEVRTSHKTLV